MNNAQLTGMRELWTAATSATTMTAREMALTPHKLNRDASVARTADGRKFNWDNSRSVWTQA
jgi:hypothetical protein